MLIWALCVLKCAIDNWFESFVRLCLMNDNIHSLHGDVRRCFHVSSKQMFSAVW